jgi:hypothetical protein
MAIQKMGALQRVSGKTKKIKGGPEGAVQSREEIKAPLMFSSKPGSTAYLSYITPEEMALLRADGRGFSEMGNGPAISGSALRQHLGPRGVPSFNGTGTAGTGESEGGMGGRGGGIGGAGTGSPTGGASAPSDESYGGAEAGDEGGGMGGPGGTDGSAGNRDMTPEEAAAAYLGSDEFLTSAYGLHPAADPNAYLWDMQGYHTPTSYGEMALGFSDLARGPDLGYNRDLSSKLAARFGMPEGGFGDMRFQGMIDETGQRPEYERFMAELPEGVRSGNTNRYMRNYLAASGVDSAYATDPFAGRAYGEFERERVDIPEWFRPGGEAPGGYQPDYSQSLEYLLANPDALSGNEALMAAGQEYLDANPDVMEHGYYGPGGPLRGFEHYLRHGREEGREFETGAIPGRAIGMAGGGRSPAGAMGAPAPMAPAMSGPLPLTASGGAGIMGTSRGLIEGPGNGRSDEVPAMLSDGEYVVPAHAVAALGDGSTDAGADYLDRLVEELRMSYSDRLRSLPGPRGGDYGIS